MQKITLIDTSVLLDLLAVPGRDQDREAIGREMKDRRTSGERFLLPITTVVETGNHIAQIKDHTRREVAERFAALLKQCLEGKAPFRFDEVLWDQTFLQTFISGAGTSVPLIDHLQQKTGAGDLCILTELTLRRKNLGSTAEVSIWTLDGDLGAYAGALC